jgi:hypothetical protein
MAVAFSNTANPAGVNGSANVASYNVQIGTSQNDRQLVVLVGGEAATLTNVSAVDMVGGNGTSKSFTPGTLGIQGVVVARGFVAWVPESDTGATFNVTFTGATPTSTENHISVYKVTDGALNPTPGANNSTDMDSNAPLTTGSHVIAANGGIIVGLAKATDTTTATWANLTGGLDVDAGAFRYQTATSTSAGTATRTATGSTNQEDGAMSWFTFTSPFVAPVVASGGILSAQGKLTSPRLTKGLLAR